MMFLLTLCLVAAAAGVAAYAAYHWPRTFRPYSESLRNLSLLIGIVLLVWNLAVAVTILALDSAGLLVAGGYYGAKQIEGALVLIGPITLVATFGSAWLYLTLLDYRVALPRIAVGSVA